jgi:hypothetical protein
MTKTEAATWLRRGLTTGLTGIAFWNSYGHTAQWFSDNGQKDSAQMLALIPEFGVILGVLILASERLTMGLKLIAGAFGLGSLSLTLLANGSAAGDGWMGLTAALVAPIFAVLGFAMEVLSFQGEPVSDEPEPVQEAQPEPQPEREPEPVHVPELELIPDVEPEPEPVREPVKVAAAKAPVSRSTARVSQSTGPRAQGQAWAQAELDAGRAWPTAAQIRAQFPDMSPATSKRIKNPNSPKTAQTADESESVNA